MTTRVQKEVDRAAPQSPPPTQRRYFPEVQGLRAVAVTIVLIYHLNHDVLPGGYVGVDVFFVISGFLITTLMLREAAAHGRVSVRDFYIRRVRRILPAATVVLLVTGTLAVVLLPTPRHADTAAQLAASATYVQNLFLANQSVDYLAAESAASPVQHFWSLAVEEQFYLLWPLLFAAWLALPVRWRGHQTILTLTGVVVALSLAVSVWLTTTDPHPAYFLPHARFWELAAGGALAVILARRSPPERVRWGLGWAGIAAIAITTLTFDGATPFPGWSAILPVAGTLAVITAGATPGRWSADALLSTRATTFVGDLSYALYLWHWPLIVFTLAHTGDAALTPLQATLILAATFALAWATKITVEDPVRTHGLLRSGARATTFALTGVLLVTTVSAATHTHQRRLQDVAFDPAVHVGPTALNEPTPHARQPEIYPPPVSAAADLPRIYDDGCQATPSVAQLTSCVYGPDDPTREVAVVGDSHAAHWIPALRKIAQDRNWRLHTYTKSSCAFTDTLLDHDDQPYRECEQWNEALTDELISDIEPDMVVTSSATQTRAHHADSTDESTRIIAAGMTGLWSRLQAADIKVLAIRDNPSLQARLPECVDQHPDELHECGQPRQEALEHDDPQEVAITRYDAPAELVDLSERFCTDQRCPPVVGNVLVYRDSNHLTATYARLLAPDLQEHL